MAFVGTLALILAFGAAIGTVGLGVLGGVTASRRWAEVSRFGLYLTSALIVVASAALLYGFLTHDFSLKYVHGRSDTRMPVYYVMAAFWGGQEGSLLTWVTVTATFSAAAAWVNRARLLSVMPWFHALTALVMALLLLVLVFVSSPFARFLVLDAPNEGEGLNPLLQTPLMTIHPPMLLSGFATFAVPWAFGMGALLANDSSTEWLRAVRRWTLISWILLTVGNILGGMWAYRELGWGGYWAWDPVENAALVPWFTASAFLHSVIIQEQRGMLKKWNISLLLATFLLTIFGTYMTRSGLIESVHTFSESEIGDWFLGIFLGLTILSVSVAAWRWPTLKSEHRIESAVSREAAFLANNWLFVAMAFVVLWGTLFPKFREMATGQAVSIGQPWFEKFMVPLGLVLLALVSIGTLLPWRRSSLRSLRRAFTVPTVAMVVLTPLLAWGYWTWRGAPLGAEPMGWAPAFAILAVALIVHNLATIVTEFVSGTRARMRSAGTSAIDAFASLFEKHRRRYGGYLVHIGMVFVFLAFLGNVAKVEETVTLPVGQTARFGDYEIRFDRVAETERPDFVAFHAEMTLLHDGEEIDRLRPARYDYNDYARLAGGRADPMKITSEIYVRSTPVEDVYVVLQNFADGGRAAAFTLVVLPFTWWFWFGGLVMIIGTFVCVWPDVDPLERRMRATSVRRRLEVGPMIAGLLLPLALLSVPAPATAQEAPVEHRVVGAPAPVPGDAAGADRTRLAIERVGGETRELDQTAWRAFSLVMAVCDGCAGKTLNQASPSCVPSNSDKARIRDMVGKGASLQQVLDAFVAERGQGAIAIPPDNRVNRVSWILPIVMMVGGVSFIALLLRAWTSRGRGGVATATGRGKVDVSDDPEQDEAYLARLREELAGGR